MIGMITISITSNIKNHETIQPDQVQVQPSIFCFWVQTRHDHRGQVGYFHRFGRRKFYFEHHHQMTKKLYSDTLQVAQGQF